MAKIPKPKHPNEINGEHFQSPGGKFLYEMVWDMHGRLSGVIATVKIGGSIVFLMLAVILAKMFGAIPE